MKRKQKFIVTADSVERIAKTVAKLYGSEINLFKFFDPEMLCYLLCVAQGELHPGVVVAFLDRPKLIWCIAGLPIDKQVSLIQGERIPVVFRKGNGTMCKHLPLTKLSDEKIDQVFTSGTRYQAFKARLLKGELLL
jgi:hypothetical protein